MSEPLQLSRVMLEFEDLRVRLYEAEQTLEAIRQGEVDALVVYGDKGEQVFTLRGAEQPYREFVEQMQEGAASLSCDGVVLWANHRLAEMLEVPLSQLIGSRMEMGIVRESHETFEALLQEAAQGTSRKELRLTSGNGALPVLASVSRSPDDESIRYAITFTDLSVHKRHDQVLASERLTRTILEQATEAVIVCSTDATVTRTNPAARRLGLPVEGEAFSDGVPIWFSGGKTLGDYVRAASQGLSVRGLDATLNTGRGTVDLVVGFAPLEIPGGGVVVTMTDITERNAAFRIAKELNESLERRVEERTEELVALNRELEGFCYSVSHDLRTPLRGMNTACHVLMQDYGEELSTGAVAELERIARNATRLAKLMDDLLAFTRLGRQPMHRETVDLTALGLSLAEEHAEQGVTIDVAPNLRADGDPNLLRLLLGNLMGNAVKFTRGRDAPHIRLQEVGEGTFVVRDNGIGFKNEYADRIFLPFERLHTERDYPGTGIGLANVERIVRRHGGRVWAEGEPDVGASFYFRLI